MAIKVAWRPVGRSDSKGMKAVCIHVRGAEKKLWISHSTKWRTSGSADCPPSAQLRRLKPYTSTIIQLCILKETQCSTKRVSSRLKLLKNNGPLFYAILGFGLLLVSLLSPGWIEETNTQLLTGSLFHPRISFYSLIPLFFLSHARKLEWQGTTCFNFMLVSFHS